MALRAYEDIVGPLAVTIRGKEYTLPNISLSDGVRMHQAGSEGAEDMSIAELVGIILGPVRDEMIGDGVPASIIDRTFYAGLADFRGGREAAEAMWEHGVPKAIQTAIQEAVETAQKTPQAAATTTKPQASTNGTKPRTARSAGKKSSPTGP
jgi:phage-related protein